MLLEAILIQISLKVETAVISKAIDDAVKPLLSGGGGIIDTVLLADLIAGTLA